jgi:hypothetical protein
LPEPLAVVCHDAGASSLIISWLRHYPGAVRAHLQGPAAILWEKTTPNRGESPPLADTLAGAAVLLSGTGWASDIEHSARKLAREAGIRSIAVLDHWVNYRERFVRQDEVVLPDELWVADGEAYVEARRCFPEVPIRQLPNLYLEELVEEVAAHGPQPARQRPRNILYVLEPIRQRWGNDDRPGELQAFQFFLDHLAEAGAGEDVHIWLRPHPSDSPGKYDDWVRLFPGVNLTVDKTDSLSHQIAWADWVVGCESFALVIALHAKRVVMSTLPPWAPRCRLPQRELRHLRDIVPHSL